MLRLVLLASISVLSGCSCESLWGRYEVPCTRGFDCPDGSMTGYEVDMRGSGNDDGGTNEDGPPGDLRGADLAGAGDMRLGTGMGDMRAPMLDLITGGVELGLGGGKLDLN